jgi:hypothetical protein
MTVSTTIIKNFHNGNASTTNFAYQFRILEDTDLLVIIRTNSTGAETTKTLSTHYTVAGAGDASGGSITFTVGNTPASGETVVIRRNVPQTQAIDYIANDPFPAETHEEGLDRSTMVAQQVAEESNRSIKLSRTNTMTSTEFTVGATDRANKVLAFDSAGEISVTQELGTFKGSDTTTTTAAYLQRDMIKSTTAGQLNNVYICVADSVIGDTLTDTDHFALLVDASDNDGDPLAAGMLYYNSVSNIMRIYSGSAWENVAVSASGFATLTGVETLTNKTINGSNNTISNVPNSALIGSGAITINGSPVSLGGSVTVGETKPTISSISPDTITNAQTSITITGSNFTSVPQVEFLNPSTGIWYVADTVTFNNSTSLTVQATLTVDAQYKIRIENPDGNSVLSSTNILTVSDAPTWTTAAGTLGTFAGDFSGTLATVVATSDSAVTFSEVGSNLTTANVTLSSGGVLSTTDFGGASTTATTYNFTIRATDAEGQTADRSFSLTSSFGATGGGQFN